MNRLRLAFATLWLLAAAPLFAACGGPLGPFAGGALSGPVATGAVDDWDFTSAVDHAQLETNPSDPHSVNTWCAGVDGALYVPTSMILGPTDPSERTWTAHVADDPRVRIRLGDTIYERRAVRVEDPAELDAARAALEAKYELDPAERDPDRTIWIYRLDPR